MVRRELPRASRSPPPSPAWCVGRTPRAIRQLPRLPGAGVPPTFAGVPPRRRLAYSPRMTSSYEPSRASPVPAAPSAAPEGDAAEELDVLEGTSPQLVPLLAVVLVLVVVVGTTDLVLNRPPGRRSVHVAFELSIILLSLICAIVLWRGWWRTAGALGRTRHKQIAARTGRSERTVRQHAVSVYERSGIGGRAELAAFYLQGLLPPREDC
jgi:hypothetical protein